ncbi:Putative ankyrin repeat protein [Sarcoptes scabiei]|uniref:Putative ankyrin repeat protein n=1 Tax=Sarcoptes scabiei TaxID=52283 RepID=A0A834VI30_SARSC|nr:Putative ankyrin repeat protein [Sarcoptes scabiei]UXI17728.1 multiple epidermal growth factor-like domains protein 11 [Sarcoptes scabiei]
MPFSWNITNQFEKAVLTNNLIVAENVIEQINTNSIFKHQKEFPLHLCVKWGHKEMVKLLLCNGANVNLMNLQGFYPLHYACMHINIEIAKILIENGADVNAYSSKGKTPLLFAVISNSLGKAGANINLKDLSHGNSTLHFACQYSVPTGLDLIEYLIANGANINEQNNDGFTPLLTAILNDYNINVPVVKILLRSGADPNQAGQYGITPLLATIRRSSDHFDEGNETVQILIDFDCNINEKEFQGQRSGETALNLSIERSQNSITEKLIRSGCDVTVRNSRGETPFFSLIKNNKYDLAKLMAAIVPSVLMDDPDSQAKLTNDFGERVEDKDFRELKRFLFERWPFFPQLQHLCRCSIRKRLGKKADKFIRKWNFSESIKQYLTLDQL